MSCPAVMTVAIWAVSCKRFPVLDRNVHKDTAVYQADWSYFQADTKSDIR